MLWFCSGNHGPQLLWLQELDLSGLTPLKPSCFDLNIITYRGVVNMRQACQSVWAQRGRQTSSWRWVEKQTGEKVGFSQTFTLITPTPAHSSLQSCCRGIVAFLWFKKKTRNSHHCSGGSSEVSWCLTSPAVPAADLLSALADELT